MLSLFNRNGRLVNILNSKANLARSLKTFSVKEDAVPLISSSTLHHLQGVIGPQGMGRVVIACINGRGGVGGGMRNLADKLRDLLEPVGITPGNIFTRSWNHGRGDEDPAGAPNIQDLKNEIFNRTKKPSYLVLIGHSYGGWAVAQLSRNLKLYHSIVPNFVGLVDPVFGASNSMGRDDYPQGNVIKNWWQNNGISHLDVCTSSVVPCSRGGGGISCGYDNVQGAESIKVNFLYDWNGNRKRVNCSPEPLPPHHAYIHAVHTNMDDNQWIWHQIYDQIASDLHQYSIVNLPARFRAVDSYRRAKIELNSFGAAFPNFHGKDGKYGVLFLKREAVEWRDVPASELGNPSTDQERFRAVDAYSQRAGFACGFPNFHQGDYNDGRGKRYGVLLIKEGYAQWRDIRASELGDPATDGARFRAVYDYAVNDQNRRTFGAAFPNFHARDYGDGQGVRYGVWLIKSNVVMWDDVPIRELEDAIMPITYKEESENVADDVSIPSVRLR